ncbi:hypothetical protein F0L17_12200 [Streptomyces sp. TRM43335]|uniref:Uncharacterized protein n=1 Tax=Streptomyces taklimakanensis TaxID=2569853 RepID=A0A6G2BCS5_9ACTN|nr:hypothetical protein [Streptomyces taklimakanensis]MTE19863.1 hypothetical protein [Streptomyces taklimakanensis]
MRTFRTTLTTALTATLTAALTAIGVGSVAATPAAATAEPAYLDAAQMPPSATPWTAGPVVKGLPETDAPCAEGVFPDRRTGHRAFRTELDTGGLQITTVAASTTRAAELVTRLRRSLATCADRVERQYPTTEASGVYHGRLAVEEGAHVYSLDTEDHEVGITDIALFSVGRDGRTVTYVQWGQMGDLADAPLGDFENTTRTAVAKLHR